MSERKRPPVERKRPVFDDAPEDDTLDEPRPRKLHPSEIIPGTAHNAYGLTVKQERFVREYLCNGCNASAAYRLVYQCSTWAENTVNVEASRLTRHTQVALRILQAKAEAARRTDVTLEKVQRELARIGFATMRNVASWGPDGVSLVDSDHLSEDDAVAVQEVGENVTKYGVRQRIKLHDKVSALHTLAKMLGGLDSDKGSDGVVEVVGGLPSEGRV